MQEMVQLNDKKSKIVWHVGVKDERWFIKVSGMEEMSVFDVNLVTHCDKDVCLSQHLLDEFPLFLLRDTFIEELKDGDRSLCRYGSDITGVVEVESTVEVDWVHNGHAHEARHTLWCEMSRLTATPLDRQRCTCEMNVLESLTNHI